MKNTFFNCAIRQNAFRDNMKTNAHKIQFDVANPPPITKKISRYS